MAVTELEEEYTATWKCKGFESRDCSLEQKLCCAEMHDDIEAPKKTR
jgi:hypothetical protein